MGDNMIASKIKAASHIVSGVINILWIWTFCNQWGLIQKIPSVFPLYWGTMVVLLGVALSTPMLLVIGFRFSRENRRIFYGAGIEDQKKIALGLLVTAIADAAAVVVIESVNFSDPYNKLIATTVVCGILFERAKLHAITTYLKRSW